MAKGFTLILNSLILAPISAFYGLSLGCEYPTQP